MLIDPLKLEQEPVVAIRGGYRDELGAGDVDCEFVLFGGGEEAVCFDADDEGAWGESGEDGGEGGGLGGEVRVIAVGGDGRGGGGGGDVAIEISRGRGSGRRGTATSPSEIVRVHLARDVDVTVGIEPGDELGALVAEIRLGREDGRGWGRGTLGYGGLR